RKAERKRDQARVGEAGQLSGRHVASGDGARDLAPRGRIEVPVDPAAIGSRRDEPRRTAGKRQSCDGTLVPTDRTCEDSIHTEVDEPESAVRRCRGEGPPVRRESELLNGERLKSEDGFRRSILPVGDKVEGSVAASREEEIALQPDEEALHRSVAEGYGRADRLQGGRVPEPHRAIGASRAEDAEVAREAHADVAGRVAGAEGDRRAFLGRIPDGDDAVAARRGEH